MIAHHPPEDLLLAMAAGHLSLGQSIVLSAHVEVCAQCRARVSMLEALGGIAIEDGQPCPLVPGALATVTRRLDPEAANESIEKRPGDRRPAPAARAATSLPDGTPLPASLQGHEITRWYWMGPGRRLSRVQLPQDAGSSVFLLSLAAGQGVPRHRHGRIEFTQVLCGSFDDGRAVFGPGDFDVAGSDIHHEPVARPGATCVCLAWVEGRVQFDGRIASALGRALGI